MRIVQMNMRLNVLKKLYQYGRKIWEDGAEWQGHQKAHIKKRREVNNVRVLYLQN